MLKRIIGITVAVGLVCGILVVPGKDGAKPSGKENFAVEDAAAADVAEEKIRGIWLSYTEIIALAKGKTQKDFREAAERIASQCAAAGLNTVFYHARAFCDALYNSDIYPLNSSLESNGTGFDILQIFIEAASEKGVRVHLWLNPYRVSYKKSINDIPASSPARELFSGNKRSLIVCEKGIYLNPACDETRALVLEGIKEILGKYKVSGIHFDDYFYPDAEFSEDGKQYSAYKKAGGRLTLSEWRRENVNALISQTYDTVKSFGEDLLFTVSPSGDIGKNKNVLFADVEKWLKEDGFADYVIPQLYYGFLNESAPFREKVEEWEGIAGESGKLLLGMSPYKCGREDENAGTGRSEWQENDNILARQYGIIIENEGWRGFVLFSFSYCFGENSNDFSRKEIKNLSDMIK